MKDMPLIMIAGLPGKMATLVAETIIKREVKLERMMLSSLALTGPSEPEKASLGRYWDFYLRGPEQHDSTLEKLSQASNPIIVDFTQPDVVNRNAELYCRHKIPFVMGTTGGDRKALEQVVVDSGNLAVIAPNMALPIVALQRFMEEFARTHENAMHGYTLKVTESHQAGKKDTSGTARAMVGYFNKLGIAFIPEQIDMIRDPKQQRSLGVPEEFLGGHGWHTYHITAPNELEAQALNEFKAEFPDFLETSPAFRGYRLINEHPVYEAVNANVVVRMHDLGDLDVSLTHNINGRQVYVDGTIDAIKFLHQRVREGVKGKAYSMIDVLKAGAK